eukprot:4526897-Prymnesium_polylepis.2
MQHRISTGVLDGARRARPPPAQAIPIEATEIERQQQWRRAALQRRNLARTAPGHVRPIRGRRQ